MGHETVSTDHPTGCSGWVVEQIEANKVQIAEYQRIKYNDQMQESPEEIQEWLSLMDPWPEEEECLNP